MIKDFNEFQKESLKIINAYRKGSLKNKYILIYKEDYKDRAHQIYPLIGIALKLQLDEETEPHLFDQQVVCAVENEKEREEIGDELFKLSKKTFDEKSFDEESNF